MDTIQYQVSMGLVITNESLNQCLHCRSPQPKGRILLQYSSIVLYKLIIFHALTAQVGNGLDQLSWTIMTKPNIEDFKLNPKWRKYCQ